MFELFVILIITFLATVIVIILELPIEVFAFILFSSMAILFIPFFYTMFTAPFVPSNKKRVETMLKLGNIQKNDTVYELGCGNGYIIRSAAKEGAKKAVGYELSLPLVLYGKLVAFLRKNPAQIRFGNIWAQDYSDADVIFCYLMPYAMKRIDREIWPQLKEGARIVSNAFPIKTLNEDKKENNVFLYIKKENKKN